jgi:uncharacterized protein (TIGR03086 family)
MTATNPFDQFDRAATITEAVIVGVKPDQLDTLTPCPKWTASQLIDHLVNGSGLFVKLVAGTKAKPNPDLAPDDRAAAFRDVVGQLRAAFAAEGALERMVSTPFGDQPGSALLFMRALEMQIHAWDLATATGQLSALDQELAGEFIEPLRGMRAAGLDAGAFDEVKHAPDNASPADQLAALAGRSVA